MRESVLQQFFFDSENNIMYTRIFRMINIFAIGFFLLSTLSYAQSDSGIRNQALTGDINFLGCTSEEQQKVRRAMEHVVSNLFVDSAFPACLGNAILSQTLGFSPEAIVERLREPLPTKIECKVEVCGTPEASGCASVGISSERISLQKANINDATVESLAGTIIHEVAHNKGWNHPPNGQFRDFNFRVPNQAGRCMEFGFSRGRLQRNLAPGETTLAGVGGEGGEPFERACPAGSFAIGGIARVSETLRRFELQCQSGTSGAAGSNAETDISISKDCRPGELVIGAWGTSDKLVNQLGLLCAPQDQIEAKNTAWVRSIGLGGAPVGLAFERLCPPGMAVKAFQGQAGGRIDQLKLVCQSLSSIRQGNWQKLDFVGTRTGNAGGGSCLGNGMLVGLFGNAGGEVDKLGGSCRTTTYDLFDTLKIGPDDSVHIVDGVGGDGGTNFGDNCPDGMALVGVRVRSGARINQIAGICARPSEWSSSTETPNRSITPTRGSSTSGTLHDLECSRKSYLVGLEVWAQKTVHATPTVQGMAPICRNLTMGRVISSN